MSTQPKPYLTPEEYLAFERSSETKHEYYRGEIFAMAGVGREHELIAGNIFADIHTQLRGRNCEVYGSDLRVQVTATGLYTYPDISVVCGRPEFADKEVDTL